MNKGVLLTQNPFKTPATLDFKSYVHLFDLYILFIFVCLFFCEMQVVMKIKSFDNTTGTMIVRPICEKKGDKFVWKDGALKTLIAMDAKFKKTLSYDEKTDKWSTPLITNQNKFIGSFKIKTELTDGVMVGEDAHLGLSTKTFVLVPNAPLHRKIDGEKIIKGWCIKLAGKIKYKQMQ